MMDWQITQEDLIRGYLYITDEKGVDHYMEVLISDTIITMYDTEIPEKYGWCYIGTRTEVRYASLQLSPNMVPCFLRRDGWTQLPSN